jgi:prepilin-type N-terminal cleavage/methylation domain-containing protein
MRDNQSGLTLIELVVVMGIILMLFGFTSFSVINTQRTVSVNGIADVLVSDLSSQQNKAMQGFGNSSGTSYGIYFEANKYTLFKGSTYSPTDLANFTVNLDKGISFANITFQGNSVVFNPVTGEVNGFSNGNNSIKILDTNGNKSVTITINRYGVVTGEN